MATIIPVNEHNQNGAKASDALLAIGSFEIQPTGLVIHGQPDIYEWIAAGEVFKRLETAIQWVIGDWLLYGEGRGDWGEMYSQALDETDYKKGTLQNFAHVAGRFEFSRRRENLSFSHHQEVAPLEPEKQDYYLGLAERNNWSKTALRKRIREDGKKRKPSETDTPAPENDILHGDMSLLFSYLPDDSVDMFFTDPPYHKDSTETYQQLARLAALKLKPGGLCLTYSGQMHLPIVIESMQQHLQYWWMFGLRHTGGHLTIWNRNLWNDWKPILVFAKPYDDGSLPLAPEWVQDFIDGGGRDKQYHEWGQDASEITYWIEKLSSENDLICDPYVGGGAVPTACKLTNRRWVGCEIDGEAVQIARQRLQEVT